MWYFILFLLGAALGVYIYDLAMQRKNGKELFKADKNNSDQSKNPPLFKRRVKDLLSIAPDSFMYNGGYTDVYKCQDCHRVTDYWTQNYISKCRYCGGNVCSHGVKKFETRNGIKGWHPPKDKTNPFE